MAIPDIQQCTQLMAQVRLPEHIREHSLRVAQASVFLGRHLNRNHLRLDLDLLTAAALLHDIAKGICLESRCSHAAVGADMVRAWGFPELAPIVAGHVFIDSDTVAAPIDESVVVNYADKRVRHTEIVDLGSRFQDLVERYAKTPEHERALIGKLALYRELEQRLFAQLAIHPNDLEHARGLNLEDGLGGGGASGSGPNRCGELGANPLTHGTERSPSWPKSSP